MRTLVRCRRLVFVRRRGEDCEAAVEEFGLMGFEEHEAGEGFSDDVLPEECACGEVVCASAGWIGCCAGGWFTGDGIGFGLGSVEAVVLGVGVTPMAVDDDDDARG